MRPVPRFLPSMATVHVTPYMGSLRAILVVTCMTLGLVGCNGDAVQPYEPVTDPAQLYMRLTLNYGAVNLSTVSSYDTFQLTATPFDALGAPMTGLPAPTFRSSDTTTVKVSSSGVLTAVQAGSGVMIIAEITAPGNVRHADTAIVNVNATASSPPELATLTIDPVPPDSAILPMLVHPNFGEIFIWLGSTIWSKYPDGSTPSLSPYLQALTASGDPVPDLQVEYISLDPEVATVDRRDGTVNPIAPGRARLVVRTVAYGVAKVDTAVFTITTPSFQNVYIRDWANCNYFGLDACGPQWSIFGPTLYVRPNGIVFWGNDLRRVGIVFDDPTAVSPAPASICEATRTMFPAPNACATDFVIDSADFRVRQFPNPGTYTYRDTLSGAVGKIVVTDSLPSES